MRPRGERNNPAMLAKQTMTTPTSWPIRAGGGGTAQSIKDCATSPSPCGQPTGATEFRQHGGKRTAVATWQLTAVPTRQLTAVPTRQLTAEPTRQLTAVPTRKLTAVLTRQLTMWPVGSATANFSHVLTAAFCNSWFISMYWQLQQQQLTFLTIDSCNSNSWFCLGDDRCTPQQLIFSRCCWQLLHTKLHK